MGGAQHLSDAGSLQGGLDDALGTGVDDGGGAAGLADDTGSQSVDSCWLPPSKILQRDWKTAHFFIENSKVNHTMSYCISQLEMVQYNM